MTIVTTTFKLRFSPYGGQKEQLATSGMSSRRGERKAIIPSPANLSHAAICFRKRIHRAYLLSFESSLGHDAKPTLDSLYFCLAAHGFTCIRAGATAFRGHRPQRLVQLFRRPTCYETMGCPSRRLLQKNPWALTVRAT